MSWVDDLYTLPLDDGIDLLFDHVDRLLTEGDFEGCDAVLRSLDISRLSIEILVAMCSATRAASDQLVGRPQVLEKIREEIRGRDPGRFQRLEKSIA